MLTKKLLERTENAMFGAAIGDALGWPYEFNSKAKLLPNTLLSKESIAYVSWTRRTGGQYYSHDERVLDGEYSDDTQLILATSRSILSADGDWFSYFVHDELPLWTLYKRGSGRATNRAADSWTKGKEPWTNKKNEVEFYLNAGGNGVAMRILPHVIYHTSKGHDFDQIARDILLNGLATHGHPRALVGAIAYGYALWKAFQYGSSLKYGQLIQDLISETRIWSSPLSLEDQPYSWKNACLTRKYLSEWEKTIGEMLDLLDISHQGMEKGALAIDQEVLTRLGCFDKTINGAGTVTAAAAIFIASRYASDPMQALIEVASARGADTDTLASMSGALLGAIGASWSPRLIDQIQDRNYISTMASKLIESPHPNNHDLQQAPRQKKYIGYLSKQLIECNVGDNLHWSRSDKATVIDIIRHHMHVKNSHAISWKLECFNGQTVYIKKYIRSYATLRKDLKIRDESKPSTFENNYKVLDVKNFKLLNWESKSKDRLRFYGVKLLVRDLRQSLHFYEQVIGLTASKVSEKLVTFTENLALSPAEQMPSDLFHKSGTVVLYVEANDIENTYKRIKSCGVKLINQIKIINGKKAFRLHDLDDNVIEIVQKD